MESRTYTDEYGQVQAYHQNLLKEIESAMNAFFSQNDSYKFLEDTVGMNKNDIRYGRQAIIDSAYLWVYRRINPKSRPVNGPSHLTDEYLEKCLTGVIAAHVSTSDKMDDYSSREECNEHHLDRTHEMEEVVETSMMPDVMKKLQSIFRQFSGQGLQR